MLLSSKPVLRKAILTPRPACFPSTKGITLVLKLLQSGFRTLVVRNTLVITASDHFISENGIVAVFGDENQFVRGDMWKINGSLLSRGGTWTKSGGWLVDDCKFLYDFPREAVEIMQRAGDTTIACLYKPTQTKALRSPKRIFLCYSK